MALGKYLPGYGFLPEGVEVDAERPDYSEDTFSWADTPGLMVPLPFGNVVDGAATHRTRAIPPDYYEGTGEDLD